MKYMLFLVFFFLYTVSSPAAEQSLVVSGHPNYPPYSWKENGELVGVGVELAKTICKELNYECKWAPVDSWNRAQELAKTGEVDVIVAIYKNSTRELYYDYTDAYQIDPTQIFVHKERRFAFSGPEDLIGRRGTAMYGESFGEELDTFIARNLEIVSGYTAKALFENLHSGRVDYILWGYYPWLINAVHLNALSWCDALPEPIVKEGMHLVFSKKGGHQHLLEKVNTLVERLKKNGTITAWSEGFLKKYQHEPRKE